MKTKTHFSYKSVVLEANIPKTLDLFGDFIYVSALVGTVELNLMDSEWIPLISGMTLGTFGKEQFDKIRLRSVAGGTCNFYYGRGQISVGPEESGNGEPQVYIGLLDDPNLIDTPDDPAHGAVYYKDDDVNLKYFVWSVTNQSWFPVIG